MTAWCKTSDDACMFCSIISTDDHLPGLVSSDVALEDNGFLFEEPEVPPAEEAPDVPLDCDCSPGLRAAPLLLQPLVQKLLEEQLTHTHVH